MPLLNWIQVHPLLGSFVYSLVFGIMTCLCIPATFPTLAAGFLFRPVVFSIIVVLLGSQIGIFLAMTLGRTVLDNMIQVIILMIEIQNSQL